VAEVKILVTGGTGFIGSHLVEALVARGRRLRCLVRNDNDITDLIKLGVEISYGDLLDKQSLEQALKAINIVYHLAAVGRCQDPSVFHKVNVEGTKNLLDACLGKKLRRFIHFSSDRVIESIHDGELIDENTKCSPVSPYGKSKYDSELLVLEYFQKYKLSVVIIRPSMVYGPRDCPIKSSSSKSEWTKNSMKMGKTFVNQQPPSGTARLFESIQKKMFRFIGKGQNLKSICYVGNLVEAALLAKDKEDVLGQVYFIADKEHYRFRRLVSVIADKEGVKLPKFSIPVFLAYTIGFVCEKISKLFKVYVPFTRSTVDMMTKDRVYDVSKAEKELGYLSKISLEEGVQQTVKWYKEIGFLQ
jgi:dihydroflavonol-4-reductase